jgi:Holliday junction resolvase RusA-like endonuclease
MTDPVTIVLLGEPVPFAHRQTKAGRRYTPEKQRHASDRLQQAGQTAVKELGMLEPLEGPLRLELLCEVAIPRSWSMKRKNSAILGLTRPITRPDLTNMLKLAEDALKGVVWRDDSLVVEQRCRKVYGKQPKLVITVSVLEG